MGDYELDEIQNAHEVTRAIGGRFWSEETLYFQARVEAIGRKLLADRNAGKADAEARIAELEAQLAAIRSELSALRAELSALTARLDIAPTHCVSNGQAGDESIVCSRCGVIVDDDELHDRADCLEHQLSGTEQAHDYVVKEMQRALDEVDSLRSELSALRPLSEAGTQGGVARMQRLR